MIYDVKPEAALEKSRNIEREIWMAYKERLVPAVADGIPWRYDQETWVECITRTEELVVETTIGSLETGIPPGPL